MSKQLLIKLLLDQTAREDERDDAAIDLAQYDNDEVEAALIQAIHDSNTTEIIRASCGASLAEIWLRTNRIDHQTLDNLPEPAKSEATGFINTNQN
ncbi:hypothetical protein AM500_04195 [Bacillus sp. FJAT-18017]|uniref:hypothetical protein n=1 Tax=Bacillus sp. FJAT-18017 TaxID=1705566 RepID=UPI0006AFF901|nr:hypothetical protein [Bacillus sp. FJAT-18017]ALC89082.1 hypothetical protein AM500_04195 [Bacillus sp. FJAT-18017]